MLDANYLVLVSGKSSDCLRTKCLRGGCKPAVSIAFVCKSPVRLTHVHVFCVSGLSGTSRTNGLCAFGPSAVGKVSRKLH